MNKLTLASEAGAFFGSLIGAIVFVLLWPGPLYPDNRVLATIPVAVAFYAFNGLGRLAWWGIQRLPDGDDGLPLSRARMGELSQVAVLGAILLS